MALWDVLLDPEILGLLVLLAVVSLVSFRTPIRHVIRRRRLASELRRAKDATRPMPTVPSRVGAPHRARGTVHRLPGAGVRRPDVWCADASQDPAVRDGVAPSTILLRGDVATRTSSYADDLRSSLIR
jgi:hypothetical protein